MTFEIPIIPTVQDMTLRDWFAVQVLAGMDLDWVVCSELSTKNAKIAYTMADAMLAERGKE